jgi:hypothetical protein
MGSMRDEQGRSRNKTVAFRMSDEELEELEKRIKLSGRNKQDFLIKSTLHQTIIVIGNRIQFESLRNQLDGIVEHLQSLEKASELDISKLTPIRTAIEIITGFTDSDKPWDDNGMTRGRKTAEICDKHENSEI